MCAEQLIFWSNPDSDTSTSQDYSATCGSTFITSTRADVTWGSRQDLPYWLRSMIFQNAFKRLNNVKRNIDRFSKHLKYVILLKDLMPTKNQFSLS